MQCASSTTNMPIVRWIPGSSRALKSSLANRCAETNRTSMRSRTRSLLDGRPVVAVRGVDRDGAEAQPVRGLDLVAHQAEQRADDERGPVALRRAGRAWRSSRRGSCPSRCAGRRASASRPGPRPRSPRAGRRGTPRPGRTWSRGGPGGRPGQGIGHVGSIEPVGRAPQGWPPHPSHRCAIGRVPVLPTGERSPPPLHALVHSAQSPRADEGRPAPVRLVDDQPVAPSQAGSGSMDHLASNPARCMI